MSSPLFLSTLAAAACCPSNTMYREDTKRSASKETLLKNDIVPICRLMCWSCSFHRVRCSSLRWHSADICLHQFRLAAAAHSGNDLDIRGSHKVDQSLHVFWSINIVHSFTSEIVIFFKFRTCIHSLRRGFLFVNEKWTSTHCGNAIHKRPYLVQISLSEGETLVKYLK